MTSLHVLLVTTLVTLFPLHMAAVPMTPAGSRPVLNAVRSEATAPLSVLLDSTHMPASDRVDTLNDSPPSFFFSRLLSDMAFDRHRPLKAASAKRRSGASSGPSALSSVIAKPETRAEISTSSSDRLTLKANSPKQDPAGTGLSKRARSRLCHLIGFPMSRGCPQYTNRNVWDPHTIFPPAVRKDMPSLYLYGGAVGR